jgi:hypothetical protein
MTDPGVSAFDSASGQRRETPKASSPSWSLLSALGCRSTSAQGREGVVAGVMDGRRQPYDAGAHERNGCYRKPKPERRRVSRDSRAAFGPLLLFRAHLGRLAESGLFPKAEIRSAAALRLSWVDSRHSDQTYR